MVKIHSLFGIRSAKEQAEIKKAMGGEATHGLNFQFKFMMALGRPPLSFSASTTNYSSSIRRYISLSSLP